MKPRIIIHGGAGNMNHDNLPPSLYAAYWASLLRILESSYSLLESTGADALTVAVHAVRMLEEDPLFNCGRGAVFTKAGTNELEASIMVSRGFRKRGCAVSTITRVKSPITLAAEMLKRGNEPDAGGAQGHVHISGAECERLAGEWGVELCDPSWFWTRKRWEQHQGGGEGIEPPPKDDDDDRVSDRVKDGNRRPDGTPWPTDDPAWDGKEYIPKGTVGCVVLDATGTLAVATSTGGLTNKLPGRIGDTPTFGAGFWAEEWLDSASVSAPAYASASAPASAGPPLSTPVLKELGVAVQSYIPNAAPLASLLTQAQHHLAKTKIIDTFRNCFSSSSTTSSSYAGSSCTQHDDHPPTVYYPNEKPHPKPQPHAVALGGTGNGDTFLRLSAASTVASLVKFSHHPPTTLQQAISWMADPNGQLQQSAGPRWGGKEGEGEGGIIGIEMVDGEGRVCWGFNRAMWRAWVDERDERRCMVFKEEY